jgi:hypothetical protein
MTTPTARDDHDWWLDTDSGFARVLNGNAVERHVPRRRVRRPSRVLRAVRALLAWLAAPSPWERRK